VNRVERASEKRDAARMMFYGGALRLRGGQYAPQELMTCIFSQILEPRGGCMARIFV
jgi:hypothetical protein